ncbi:hypothetical protein C8P63_11024 [Melghirimyces profundicolus]|uniref:Uncharacterized protein n=1 Tax=Melghirimyces profundicolus TaxID=1242148 RepID=A0A2T6BUX5_9BACL|nr:hypothetical protein C8P63_11024 [Melghirimyces profundicolus]
MGQGPARMSHHLPPTVPSPRWRTPDLAVSRSPSERMRDAMNGWDPARGKVDDFDSDTATAGWMESVRETHFFENKE